MLVAATLAAVLAVVLAGWAGVRAARDRPVILRQLYGAGVVELALLGQAAVAAAAVAGGHDLAEPVTLWGYLLTAAVVLPAAGAWAFVDRTRWSSVVLLVGGLTVAVMELRVLQLWGQAG